MPLLAWQLTGTACLVVGSGHGGLSKSKKEAHLMDLGATGGLKAQSWHRWTVGAKQLMGDLG